MKKAWETKTLGEVCEVFADGDWVESKDQSTEGIRLIQTGNVGEGVFKDRSEKARYISEATFKRLRCTEIVEGDCLVSRLPDPVGRSCILPDTGERMITAVDCTILRFNPKQLLPTFFNLYSQSDNYLTTVAKECTGTTRNRISRSNLGQTPIPVPPLPEQQRIVALLDEAFAGVATAKANAERNLQNARALFESHLEAVFSQRGSGWMEKPLSELCERITKGSSPKWQGISYVDSPGVLFVTSENVGEYAILLNQPKYVEDKFNAKDKKSILKSGDVLTNIVGASIGRTAVFDRDDVANINQAVCLIRCEPHLLNNYYLAYLLNSPVFKQVLHDNEVNNARANLSLGFFSQLLVPMPSIPKQREIVAKLDAFREETQRLTRLYESRLAALEELKRSLLHQAFNGEL
jgi:type I restriction enzyme S subunit